MRDTMDVKEALDMMNRCKHEIEMVVGQLAASHDVMPAVLANDAGAWALRINARWRQSIENYFETGDLLIDAKATLPHGAFETMIETALMFHPSTARRLMIIAKDQRLRARVHALPASWGTIYELTKLSDDELDRGFEAKIIHAEMERVDVELIRPTPPRGHHESQAKEPEASGGLCAEASHAVRVGEASADLPATSEFMDVIAGRDRQPFQSSDGAQDAHQSSVDDARETKRLDMDAGVAPGPSEAHSPPMPSGGLAIVHQRDTSDEDPREFFPTPPWATRALVERVLVHLNRRGHCGLQKVWEPACGEGHMAEPLKEYFRAVFASDKYQYGYAAPHIDFLEFNQPISTDWIITNPPFRQSTAFVQKAIKIAGTGVAMFVRLAWIEGVTRYEQLLRDNPPSLLSIFTERVPLHKGRWEPDGGTFTAYAWLVWIKGMPPQPPFWIPPGCRKDLFKPDDVKRFGKIAEAEEAA